MLKAGQTSNFVLWRMSRPRLGFEALPRMRLNNYNTHKKAPTCPNPVGNQLAERGVTAGHKTIRNPCANNQATHPRVEKKTCMALRERNGPTQSERRRLQHDPTWEPYLHTLKCGADNGENGKTTGTKKNDGDQNIMAPRSLVISLHAYLSLHRRL